MLLLLLLVAPVRSSLMRRQRPADRAAPSSGACRLPRMAVSRMCRSCSRWTASSARSWASPSRPSTSMRCCRRAWAPWQRPVRPLLKARPGPLSPPCRRRFSTSTFRPPCPSPCWSCCSMRWSWAGRRSREANAVLGAATDALRVDRSRRWPGLARLLAAALPELSAASALLGLRWARMWMQAGWMQHSSRRRRRRSTATRASPGSGCGPSEWWWLWTPSR
mmetsp:Transcript_149291/g.478239  ORF Transcript_149291/g.478239 Transcript_149291/m.478239 type:complete len:221 (-) Transcript_149291:413-1075(-)